MRNTISLLSILPLVFSLACKKEAKPNVIIILADDLGYSDLGCFGSEIETPTLDSLAAIGQRQTQFYTSGRSCPSRACLLTGLDPHVAGIGDMVGDDDLPGYRGFLTNQSKTIAEVLKQEGYATYMAGKWHVGDNPQHWPRKRGFDRYFGLINGASSYFDNRPYRNSMKSSLTFALDDSLYSIPDSGFYTTDAITNYALTFLNEHTEAKKKNPYFLYLAYTAPHWPLHALPIDIAKYRNKYNTGFDSIRLQRFRRMKSIGIIDNSVELSPRDKNIQNWNSLSEDEKNQWSLKMAVYAAMIDRMDQNIHRVIDFLKKNGQFENTVIMFMSDNGACHERIKNVNEYIQRDGEAGSQNSWDAYGIQGANVSNTPFKMYKHWMYEGGIASPFIIYYPKEVKANTIHNVPMHLLDIMPTIIEMCGASYLSSSDTLSMHPLKGHSLIPYFKANNYNAEKNQYFLWEHEGNRAFRKGNWKIVSEFDLDSNRQGEWQLYNLGTDRSESINIANENKAILDMMVNWYEKDANHLQIVPYEKLRNYRLERKSKDKQSLKP